MRSCCVSLDPLSPGEQGPAAGSGRDPDSVSAARLRVLGRQQARGFVESLILASGNTRLILNEFPPPHQILQLLVWLIKPHVVSKLIERKKEKDVHPSKL